MKKLILILVVICTFCGCNKISNKPIYEELTINEVDKAMKQEPSFGDFYDDIIRKNYAEKMSPSEKARFKKVSYRRLYAYEKYRYDFVSWQEKDSIWDKEWTQKYAKEIASTDSVINYWKERKLQCNAEIDKYVKGSITNVGIETEYEYNWISHMNERVSHRVFDVTYTLFVPKVEKVNYEIMWRDKYGSAQYGHDGYSDGGFYDIDITKGDTIRTKICGGLSENKPAEIWITSIMVDGREIKSTYNKYEYPHSVCMYLANGNEYEWNAVGREFVGENFMSKYDYERQERERDLRAFDNL